MAFIGPSFYNPYAEKLEPGSNDIWDVCTRSTFFTPEIFLYCLYTKEYCEQNETLEFLLYQDGTFCRIFGE